MPGETVSKEARVLKKDPGVMKNSKVTKNLPVLLAFLLESRMRWGSEDAYPSFLVLHLSEHGAVGVD